MGFSLQDGACGAGALFVGDGTKVDGWYRAWRGRDDLTVVTCDFTILVDTLFQVDTRRYLTVRLAGSGQGEPAATAYIETREGWVTSPIPADSHFAYVEVEYFDDALYEAFREVGWNSVSEMSRIIASMSGGIGWSAGALRALEEISRADPHSPGAALVYEGQAKALLGSLIESMADALPKAPDDRTGILRDISLVHERWRDGVNQQEAARAAGMGLTKFKRLFRQTTGCALAEYVTGLRMREARELLERGHSVARVANSVGYRSPTSFSAAFERVVGTTPGRYRDSARMSAVNVEDATT